jgi:hypothetical protein
MGSVNANECDFFSLEARLSGAAPLVGFTKIAYPWEIERAHVTGNSRVPLGTTGGRLTPQDSSVTVRLGTYNTITQRRAWAAEKYTLALVYALKGQVQHKVTLKGVMFKGADESAEEGADPLARELKFTYERIFINGFCPLTGEAEDGGTT